MPLSEVTEMLYQTDHSTILTYHNDRPSVLQ